MSLNGHKGAVVSSNILRFPLMRSESGNIRELIPQFQSMQESNWGLSQGTSIIKIEKSTG